MRRRRFLAVAGAGSAVGLAGCLGGASGSGGGSGDGASGDADDGGGSDGEGDGAGGSDGGGGGQSIDAHPAATDLEAQPRLGDLGGHVVLAFEDPSCTRCRAFERGTVPEVEANLVDAGKGAFVFRGFPVVYPWGRPATAALEATFDRSEPAFWALKDHYFDAQGEFDSGNVLDRTAAFLDAETDVDGAAVVADVEAGAADAAVEADVAAAEAAGLRRITPTVLLFRDGNFATKATGSVSYDLVASVLGV